jgi:hypothetical protein
MAAHATQEARRTGRARRRVGVLAVVTALALFGASVVPLAAQQIDDPELLSDHILTTGGLTADDRPVALVELIPIRDDTGPGDIYHAFGPPGIEPTDGFDITDVALELWEFEDEIGSFGWTFQPDDDVYVPPYAGSPEPDDAILLIPAEIPDFAANPTWLVATLVVAGPIQLLAEPSPAWYSEFMVGWTDPELPVFDAPAEGDLFDGINTVTVVSRDPQVGFEVIDLSWDGTAFNTSPSSTLVAAGENQVTFMFPFGLAIDAGSSVTVDFNFGSYASIGGYDFDPATAGADIVKSSIDVGDIRRFSIYPFVPSEEPEPTEEPAPDVVAADSDDEAPPADEPPAAEAPEPVVEDAGGTSPLLILLLAAIVLGLLWTMLASWWYWPPSWRRRWPPWKRIPADGKLVVDKPVNGTKYTLCSAKGCRFHKDGVCKSHGGACGDGCSCRSFRRPKKGWDGMWEFVPGGRKAYLPGGSEYPPSKQDNPRNFVWECLCVR